MRIPDPLRRCLCRCPLQQTQTRGGHRQEQPFGDQIEFHSADKDWADPIVGLRGQWNINDKWYLAGKGDIGGFGVSSDFTWNLQATVGYNFNECVSAEIGYRYFDTDYDDGGFTYDVAQAGLLLGVNFRF